MGPDGDGRRGARPRVALLGGDGGPSGVPRHLRHLAAALRGVAEVAVVSEPDRGGYAWAEGMGARHLAVEGLSSSADPARAARAARALGAALDRLAPDLVWAHARMTLPLARRLARERPWRLAATYHGLPFGPGHGWARSALSRALEEASLRWAPPHHLVFLTGEDRDAFPPRHRRRHRAHVLPNASDLGGFGAPRAEEGPSEGPLRLLMLTRDARQKDLPLAARIFARMGEGAELHLHGIGTDDPGLAARLASHLGPAAPRVRFGGPVADVRPALGRADLLLVTSRYEGLSIAMIEAMEMGVPVASTPVGGTARLGRLHPMFALLDPADPDAAAQEALRLARAFRADRPRLARETHAAWASAFSPEVFGRNARALLARMLA